MSGTRFTGRIPAHLARVTVADTVRLGTGAGVDAVMGAAARAGSDRFVALGDTWPALHFLLSGDVPVPKPQALALGLKWYDDAVANVLMGGEATGRDAGFGPVRHLPPERVKRMAALLDGLAPATLMRRFDAQAMATESIPTGQPDDEASVRARLTAAYDALRSFYLAAATAGDGVLIEVG